MKVPFAVLMVAATLVLAPVARAADHHNITLTFIRHAESTANAAHIIDTSVPGPDLTPLGASQAVAVAINPAPYDGIWASTMVRTQETAAPLSAVLHEPVDVLDGLKEIPAEDDEGKPTSAPQSDAPKSWLRGDRTARIPGAIDGDEFEASFNSAVQAIYDSGETSPVAFSHGWSIAYWVLMNTRNADPALAKDLLPNTARVVITGNPDDGWTLVSWNGMPV